MSLMGAPSNKVIQVSLNWKTGDLNKPQILYQLSKFCVQLEIKKLGNKYKHFFKKNDTEDQEILKKSPLPHQKGKIKRKPVSQMKI